jgi:hypothetical protein
MLLFVTILDKVFMATDSDLCFTSTNETMLSMGMPNHAESKHLISIKKVWPIDNYPV